MNASDLDACYCIYLNICGRKLQRVVKMVTKPGDCIFGKNFCWIFPSFFPFVIETLSISILTRTTSKLWLNFPHEENYPFFYAAWHVGICGIWFLWKGNCLGAPGYKHKRTEEDLIISNHQTERHCCREYLRELKGGNIEKRITIYKIPRVQKLRV